MMPASFIEYSLLKQTSTIADIELLCKEAMQYKFAAVCVPPMFVKKANELILGSEVKVATVIGFPFGYNAIEAKLAEAVLAIVDGAAELNMVINLVALKNKDWQYLAKEINTILPVIRKAGKKIKLIIEAGLLTNEEIIACCDMYGAAGIDFMQTSTGFSTAVISIETLRLMRLHLSDTIKIVWADKTTEEEMEKLIKAGAERIIINTTSSSMKSNLHGMIFENEHTNKN